jgi:hypothetical protein
LIGFECVFVFNDKRFSYSSWVISTVGEARQHLSSDLELPVFQIGVYSDETSDILPDSERLRGRTYLVKRMKIQSLHCFLYLKPIPPVGRIGILTREVTIDFDGEGIHTVGDLLNRHFPGVEFPFSEPLKVLNGVTELSSATFLEDVIPDSILMMKYPAPGADAVYNLVFPGKEPKLSRLVRMRQSRM